MIQKNMLFHQCIHYWKNSLYLRKTEIKKNFFYRINFCASFVPSKALSKGIFLRGLPKRLMDGIMFQTLFKATFYLV